MDIPVTSVTKSESTIGHSAAAIFVITPEMIRRTGVTTIPDALRMVPGMDVAQMTSNRWAISCRGFNSGYANKLLVLIDGRCVYNPDFSGVFWDAQDVLLEDVERIEVIRGPGGTLWGANAVNGVINIITKKAKDTQGAYVMGGGGTHEKDMEAARYGGQIGEDIQYRVYGKHFERGANYDPTGQIDDAWRQGRYGFRMDWTPGGDDANSFTFQGDVFNGPTDNCVISSAPTIPENFCGGNLLMRWTHTIDEESDWSLQTYYDRFSRIDSLQSEIDQRLDVEFQYRFPLGDRHSITCGAGFRNDVSYFSGGDAFGPFFPTPYFTMNYLNQFVQDEITLIEDKLALTLGCKLEQNPFTGMEYQPTIRALWTPDRRHSFWGAVSRAIRAPSRYEEQVTMTIPLVPPVAYYRLYGQSGLPSETLIAYELGYREQMTDRFSWDIATFYNTYDQLYGAIPLGMPFPEPTPPPPHLIFPVAFYPHTTAQTYGVEIAGNYAVSERWKIYAQYTVFEMNTQNDPLDSFDGRDPHNQVYLRSAWNIRDDIDFDLMARYVDSLTFAQVPSYITMDLRLAWRPRKHLELAVVGQNLLQEHHLEFIDLTTPTTQAVRGVYGTLTWRR